MLPLQWDLACRIARLADSTSRAFKCSRSVTSQTAACGALGQSSERADVNARRAIGDGDVGYDNYSQCRGKYLLAYLFLACVGAGWRT